MTELRDLIREIIREEIEAARHQSVSNRYKMVRVNNVLVPSAGKVYVVPVDNEATFPEIVVNRRVAAVEGLEVVVGVDNTSNVRQVLDIFDGEIFDQDDYTGQSYQPLHAPDHGWTSQSNPPFNNPAVDAVSIGQRGFLPLRARPAAAGGTKIDIAPFTYEFNSSWKIYPGSTSFDLTSNIPATASKQVFTLVYLNKTTNTILTVDSSESIYSKIIRPAFPTLPSGKIEPIVLVRMYNGQTSISEAYDIYDARRVIGTAESDDANIPYRIAGAVGSGGSASQPTTADDIAVTDDVHFKSQMLIGGSDGDTPDKYVHINITGGTAPSFGVSHNGLVIQQNNATDEQARLYLISGNEAFSAVDFGDVDSAVVGQIVYKHGASDNYMYFVTNGSEAMRILSDGKVGIGTDAPDKTLHIDLGGTLPTLNSTDGLILQNNAATGDAVRIFLVGGDTSYCAIDFGDSSDGVIGQISYDHDNERMNFYVNNNYAMAIDSSQQVGIGTQTPGSQVEINLATEDLEIVDAGSASATEQDWIEVQVGGVTGYIRVYATK